MQGKHDTDISDQSDHRPNRDIGITGRGKKLRLRDQFVRVLLMGYADGEVFTVMTPSIDRSASTRHHLLRSNPNTKANYRLPETRARSAVSVESPAIEVMTDFYQVEPITIRSLSSVEEANQTMIKHGVRSLFVVDDDRRVLGFVTASDILGEKPMQITQQRGLHHHEVTVQDIMIPAARLKFIDLSEVFNAQVGDVVDTLKHVGRQHALVVERPIGEKGGRQMIRGIFSLTQIARQLGLKNQVPEIDHTFADIVSTIGL